MRFRSKPTFAVALVLLAQMLAGCAPRDTATPLPVDPVVETVVPEATVAVSSPVPAAESTSALIPAPASPGSPTATPTPLVRGQHEVVPGDTLIGIALQYDVSVEDLLRVNALANPDLLAIGQTLRIPGMPEDDAAVPSVDDVDGQTRLVCPETSRVYRLDLAAEPIQLAAVGDTLYFVADGGLYSLLLEELGREPRLAPVDLTPRGNVEGVVGIQELVYLAHDAATDDLYLLDKSNDIFRLDPTGQWHVALPAAQIPGIFPDPQYLALAVYDGVIYILDADLGRIWRATEGVPTPEDHFVGGDVGTGMDLAMDPDDPGGRFYVLTRAGTVTALTVRPGPDGAADMPISPAAWPAQIRVHGDRLMVVDGQARSVAFYGRSTQAVADRFLFRHPDMPRLRNATMVGSMLLAVGGPNLYAASLGALTEPCPAVTFDDRFYVDGVDVRTLLPALALPFREAALPSRPRSYPGARRLYRHGVHAGLDMYALDVPGLTLGTTVEAIADGVIVRADHDYAELTPAEYDAAEEQTRREHRTNLELADLLLGRQVHITHSEEVASVYAHLSAVPAAVIPGRAVLRRTPIGAVGVSGTSAGAYGTTDGVHLHFEVWVNGRYLGQGLSIYETMLLWAAVFE